MAHIVAISNQKGGVGKTTTCLSLGASLAQAGWHTLVVDLDPQASLTLAAGLDSEALEQTVVDLLQSDSPLAAHPSLILPTAVEGLDILPADARLAGAERWLMAHDQYELALLKALAHWQDTYQYILIDCPPTLGALALTGLAAANTVLAPIQPEFYAARGLQRLLDTVAAVRERFNPDLRSYLVATMFDKRVGISGRLLEQLRATYGDLMLATVIGVDTRLRECPLTGEPITLYAPASRGSQHYQQLAQELIARMQPERTVAV